MRSPTVHTFRCVKALLVGCAAALLSGCAPGGAALQQGATKLEPCRVQGVDRLAECGTVEVFEDRDVARGTKIALRVVRLVAAGSERAPDPLFMLAGGPGQAASEAFPAMLAPLAKTALKRDVVLVDQRGTGSSGPLDCPYSEELGEQLRDRLEDVAKRCVGRFDADLSSYSTAAAADDLDEVRSALGYERINLLGVSYGTRLALVYAQRHPQRVRSIVIDSVAPPTMKIPLSFSRDGQRAFEAMLSRCRADQACQRAFPDLSASFAKVLAQLAKAQQVTVRHPRSGEEVTITLDRDIFAQAIRGLLYSPEFVALMPLTIERAAGGDFNPLVAQVSMLAEEGQQGMSMGLMLSVVCSEDVRRIDDSEVAAQTDGTFLGAAMIEDMRAACGAWPASAPPDGWGEPVVADTPVLALSGEHDPVTPPSWGEAAIAALPNGRHLVLPAGGHGVFIRGCMPKLVRRFFDAPERLATLDASCLEQDPFEAPRFFIDFAGPPH